MKTKLFFLVIIVIISNGLNAATTPDGLSDKQWGNIQNQIAVSSQQAYIKPSNTASNSLFGFSTALFMDTLVVGAGGESSDTGVLFVGAVYVFTRTAGVWTQQARLQASNPETNDGFGHSVSISGDTLVVGAAREDSNAIGVGGNELDNSASDSGAAYVFTRTSGVWTQQAYLKSSNTANGGSFGSSVAISGDTIVVGASNETHSANQSGAAYVFVRNAGVWNQQADLFTSANSIGATTGHFGNAVAILNNTIAVAAQDEFSNTGGVHLFTRTATTWNFQTMLMGSNTESNDHFGASISLEGDSLVIGASGEASNATGVNGNQSDNSISNAGAAYVFTRTGGVWTQQAYLKASNPDAGDGFGNSVAISGNIVVIGAHWEQSNGTGVNGNATDNSINASGAAYSFIFQGGNWVPQSYIKASNTQQAGQGDWFGNSVTVFGQTVVVGAPWEDSSATGINGNQNDESSTNSGAVYVYTGTIAATYTVGGSVSGLAAGNSVTLQNNAGDDLVISSDGIFTFATALTDSSNYNVTVLTQPTTPNQACTVSNAVGTIAGVDVSNVMVVCVTNSYTVGGSVSGLAAGNSVTLQNNAGDDLVISSDGIFTFATALTDSSNYNITVLTQPTMPNQTCLVTNALGQLQGSNITSVIIICTNDPLFSVGGNVTGLMSGDSLVVQNNGSDDLSITANGPYTFATSLLNGENYSVSILSQTTADVVCSVNQNTGTVAMADITNVDISCGTLMLSLSTSLMDFGSVPYNTNQTQILTLTNDGTFNIEILSISLPIAPFYIVNNNCAAILLPTESCEVVIEFMGESIGQFSSELIINSNAISSPDIVNLSGSVPAVAVPTLTIKGLLLMFIIVLLLAYLSFMNSRLIVSRYGNY